MFQKIGHLSHIACPLNADGPQLIQKCCLCHFDQKDLEGMSFDKEMVFEASFFCCGADALMLAIGGNSFSTSSVPTQPVAMLLWQRMSKLFNTWCILVSQSPTQFARFPGPKMTQGWHFSLAARATPS